MQTPAKPRSASTLRDLRSNAIELVRAVRRLADKHELRVADCVQQRVEIAVAAVEG